MLLLKEFERIPIGPKWDCCNRIVGSKEVTAIESFQAKSGKALLQLGHRSIQATNWVGTLGVGKHCLEVIPKIDDTTGTLDGRRTRENLLWMVSRAGMVPIAPADIAWLADPQRPLLAAFLQLYVDKLSREWQRGPIKVYVTQEENRPFLRGKLMFQDHLRQQQLIQIQYRLYELIPAP
jgi:5-methylcytosine-specific restriction enzyme subunit McrC